MPESGNEEQVDRAVDKIADRAIARFVSQHPEVRRGTVVAEIPPPLKWAAIVATSVLTVAASGGLLWMVNSVSEMSVTLARMDERMARYTESGAATDERQDREIRELQAYHRNGSGR